MDETPGDVNTSHIVTGRHTPEKREMARHLRREMTPAERVLWQAVRGAKLGVHIRRQQLIDGFCADFYCHGAALVIEVDGPLHDAQHEADAAREFVFRGRGLCILRFTNDEVRDHLPNCLLRIKAAANAPNPRPFP